MAKKLEKTKINLNTLSVHDISQRKPKADHCEAQSLKTNTLDTQTHSQKFKLLTDDHMNANPKGKTDDSILNTNKSSNF
jgi:hypothetical protein